MRECDATTDKQTPFPHYLTFKPASLPKRFHNVLLSSNACLRTFPNPAWTRPSLCLGQTRSHSLVGVATWVSITGPVERACAVTCKLSVKSCLAGILPLKIEIFAFRRLGPIFWVRFVFERERERERERETFCLFLQFASCAFEWF